MDSNYFLLMGLFFLGINIPCVVIALIGMKYFDMLGRFPSKTPKIQKNIVLKLAMLEGGTFLFLFALFKVLSPPN